MWNLEFSTQQVLDFVTSATMEASWGAFLAVGLWWHGDGDVCL